ncbi:MAG: adenylate/guanylate cyclase domain-containing protein, partial [Deltaproteobacteria bacterium]|nr:adenylate/guanylate cyclase domain-containing protein [Deltaproteobacteria bacterium]
LGERYFRSTVAGLLAKVLWQAGDAAEADRYCTLAEQLADPDDMDSQVLWRLTSSRLLAATDPAGARAVADEAVAMADTTAGLILRADALRSRAELLFELEDGPAAEASLADAANLYERKGDVVSASALNQRLARGAAAETR